MRSFLAAWAVFFFIAAGGVTAQTATAPKPVDHVLGTVTAVNAADQSVTVKEDRTATEYTVQLANTKTLIKVEPGAKDLTHGTRFSASDLAVGDRVDIRGSKSEGAPSSIAARSVVLMSGRDLQQAHQQEMAAWQHSTTGIVATVDSSSQKVTINVRTPEGPKPVTIQAQNTTQFLRYSPETPKTPVRGQLSDIHAGDQIRVIGDTTAADATIAAQKIFSGTFQTVAATVVSISPDGKQVTVRSLTTKQPITVDLNDASSVRRLPPPIAMGLARRLNPSFRPAAGDTATQRPASDHPAAPGNAPGETPRGPANGDLSRIIERLPQIALSDLKPGDAVVVSGADKGNGASLVATTIIAGVEPIFQSAPARSAESLGNWNLDMSIPAQ